MRHLSLEKKKIFQKYVYRNVKILGIETDVNIFGNLSCLSVFLRAEDLTVLTQHELSYLVLVYHVYRHVPCFMFCSQEGGSKYDP